MPVRLLQVAAILACMNMIIVGAALAGVVWLFRLDTTVDLGNGSRLIFEDLASNGDVPLLEGPAGVTLWRVQVVGVEGDWMIVKALAPPPGRVMHWYVIESTLDDRSGVNHRVPTLREARERLKQHGIGAVELHDTVTLDPIRAATLPALMLLGAVTLFVMSGLIWCVSILARSDAPPQIRHGTSPS